MGCHSHDSVSLYKKTETLYKRDPPTGFEEANSHVGNCLWRGSRGRERQAAIRVASS